MHRGMQTSNGQPGSGRNHPTYAFGLAPLLFKTLSYIMYIMFYIINILYIICYMHIKYIMYLFYINITSALRLIGNLRI